MKVNCMVKKIILFLAAAALSCCNLNPELVDEAISPVKTRTRIPHTGMLHRSNTKVALRSRDALKSLDRGSFDAVDYFQNESIKVKADLSNPENIGDVTLRLYNERNELILSFAPVNAGINSPEWQIAGDALRKLGMGLEDGRHLLRAEISAGNTETDDLGWFIWDAGSDKPRISHQGEMDGVIHTEEGGEISVYVFDDDNLGPVYSALFTKSEIEKILPGLSSETRRSAALRVLAEDPALRSNAKVWMGSQVFASSGDLQVRDYKFSIPAPQPGNYFLLTLASDQKASGEIWTAALSEVRVIGG